MKKAFRASAYTFTLLLYIPSQGCLIFHQLYIELLPPAYRDTMPKTGVHTHTHTHIHIHTRTYTCTHTHTHTHTQYYEVYLDREIQQVASFASCTLCESIEGCFDPSLISGPPQLLQLAFLHHIQ